MVRAVQFLTKHSTMLLGRRSPTGRMLGRMLLGQSEIVRAPRGLRRVGSFDGRRFFYLRRFLCKSVWLYMICDELFRPNVLRIVSIWYAPCRFRPNILRRC